MSTTLVSRCPRCFEGVVVDESRVGQRVTCQSCGQSFPATSFVAGPECEGVEAEADGTGVATSDRAGDTRDGAAQAESGPPQRTKALGPFQLIAVMGQGGFGRVFRARDPRLNRDVALKIPNFLNKTKHRIQRFLREAQTAAQLQHPNIVAVFESGRVDGRYFIASQFIDGETLSQRLKAQMPSHRESATWMRDLARAVAYAHEKRIIHRDIKPQNIMVDQDNQVLLMDFGLAKNLDDDVSMTAGNAVLGTPAYMSPEQARGDIEAIGPLSDVYSLGTVLYELLAGRRPFRGEQTQLLSQICDDEPPPLSAEVSDVPQDLEAICLKSMEKLPARRYGSAQELADDLDHWLDGRETVARPLETIERLRRWRQDNNRAAWMTLTAVLALLITSVSALAGYVWTTNARARAMQLNAEREAANASQATLTRASQAAAVEAKQQAHIAEASTSAAHLTIDRAHTIARQAADELTKSEQLKDSLKDTLDKLDEEERKRRESEKRGKQNISEFNKLLQPLARYKQQLNQVQAAIQAQNWNQARDALKDCEAEQRGWEWDWLQAAVERQSTELFPWQGENLAISKIGEVNRGGPLEFRVRFIDGLVGRLLVQIDLPPEEGKPARQTQQTTVFCAIQDGRPQIVKRWERPSGILLLDTKRQQFLIVGSQHVETKQLTNPQGVFFRRNYFDYGSHAGQFDSNLEFPENLRPNVRRGFRGEIIHAALSKNDFQQPLVALQPDSGGQIEFCSVKDPGTVLFSIGLAGGHSRRCHVATDLSWVIQMHDAESSSRRSPDTEEFVLAFSVSTGGPNRTKQQARYEFASIQTVDNRSRNRWIYGHMRPPVPTFECINTDATWAAFAGMLIPLRSDRQEPFVGGRVPGVAIEGGGNVLAFLPRGKRVFVAQDDTLWVCDLRTGQQVIRVCEYASLGTKVGDSARRYPDRQTYVRRPLKALVSPDGRTLFLTVQQLEKGWDHKCFVFQLPGPGN